MSRIIDIVCGPWAITPEMLIEIQGIYATHLRGEKIDIEGIEARLGHKLDNRHETFEVRDGVAVIPIEGAIAKRMNLFSRISGGASTEIIKRDVETALADPSVRAIILSVDSPGGTVDGTAELAEFIFANRGQKPLVAHSDGMVASAAYWIASATDSVWISGDTNAIGSIGVVAAHRDYSRQEERSGVKTTEITAGKYKRISSQYEPLSDEGRADIKAKVDYLYSAFVDAVAKHRGVESDDVLERMADGRVFLGKQSIRAGLVDGVSSLDDLIDQLAAGATPGRHEPKQKAAAGVAGSKPLAQEQAMTKEELKAKHPELYQSLVAEGREAATAEHTEAIKKATGEERVRIVALVSAGFGEEPGKKFAAVVEKGLSAEDLSALGITFGGTSSSADLESREEILGALKEGGNKPLGKAKKEEGDKDFNALVADYRKANPDASLADAMKAVAKANPAAHEAYLHSANESRR